MVQVPCLFKATSLTLPYNCRFLSKAPYKITIHTITMTSMPMNMEASVVDRGVVGLGALVRGAPCAGPRGACRPWARRGAARPRAACPWVAMVRPAQDLLSMTSVALDLGPASVGLPEGTLEVVAAAAVVSVEETLAAAEAAATVVETSATTAATSRTLPHKSPFPKMLVYFHI